MWEKNCKKIAILFAISFMLVSTIIIIPSENVSAGSYDGEDLALAILANFSWLIDSSYSDTDEYGTRQSIVLEQKGTMHPTNGNTFALFSTGIAGTDIITSNENEPGSERGEWFDGGQQGYPRDEASLEMTLEVPPFMHYLYYDLQFFSAEYPEYVGTQYNDKLTVTVESPSEGTSQYIFDINSGFFLLDSNAIPNTGFDIFAQSRNPEGVDWVDTYQRTSGADAGASDLIQMGGLDHPVSPGEQITVTISIRDVGDNQFDSGAFIDNMKFTGYAKTDILARKTVEDLNEAPFEVNDEIKYRITISNTGDADQHNNPGNEFEDILPNDITYVAGSATATSGVINYEEGENKITWDGGVPAESSVILEFHATINTGLSNGTIISNQGTVFWDSNGDRNNDATELTDNPYVDDGIDQDDDNETDDDDPTNLTVTQFEYPDFLIEDFSDDATGGKATQEYYSRQWFETSEDGIAGTSYEVVSGYYYNTPKSFKTKIRQSGSPQYWNYTFEELDGDMISWEAWLACGDASEEANLFLDFENNLGQDIAKIKMEYMEEDDEDTPINWYLELSYWDPELNDYKNLSSDFAGGYLRNDWYKLKIEKYGDNHINYSLYRSGVGLVDSDTGQQLTSEFANFEQLKLYSTKNPIVCPMFFWDEHIIGLS